MTEDRENNIGIDTFAFQNPLFIFSLPAESPKTRVYDEVNATAEKW